MACGPATQAGSTCRCDVRALKPLQGALGIEEVRALARTIAADPKEEMRYLADDPIKVVHGPSGLLYITDHHHGADALRLAGQFDAICQIVPRPAYATDAGFWSQLQADHLVRLADQQGKSLTPAQLPPDLAHMPDDPYRSLAWRLRKAGGYCRADMRQKEFAEFVWADWLRTRLPLPAGSDGGTAGMLPAALALARGPAASGMPGYVGDKPAGYRCRTDD